MMKVMTGSYSSCVCAQCKGGKKHEGKKESHSPYVCALSMSGKNMREKQNNHAK